MWFGYERENVGQWALREDGLTEVFGGLLGAGGLAGQVWAIRPWDWPKLGIGPWAQQQKKIS